MASITRDMKERKDVKEKEPKRRRTIKTEPRSGGVTAGTLATDPKKTKSADVKHTPLPNMFYQEEEQVVDRPLADDMKLHAKACDEIRKVAADIRNMRMKPSPNKDALEEKRIHGTLQFVTLKKLNRVAHMRCKRERDATNEAKQKIDQQHLQLQNLLYEVMHLQKEITKCLEFKSKDEDINLVPVDEFYATAPEEISKPDVTKKDEHQQTLARLDWELEQRKRLSVKLTEAVSMKKELCGENEKLCEYLDSLHPKLGSVLASTRPVQEYLGIPFDEVREQHRTARFLPRPLYVLYMQTTAYRDACDKNLEVMVHGDLDVARAMDNSSSDVEEESDSDQEEQEKQNAKRHRRGSSDRQGQKKQRLLKKHPLFISIVIKTKDGYSMNLDFFYVTFLQIVTVTVSLSIKPDTSSITGGDLLSSDQVLSCLYPGDHGNTSPNPANEFILNKLGLGEFSQFVSVLGRPYQWVQAVCGLDFINAVSTETPDMRSQAALSASHIESTIRRVRARVEARLALLKQLSSLEQLTIPVMTEDMVHFPAKISARLREWRRGTHEDFCALPYTESIQKAGLATRSDMYFYGQLERGSAKMTFHVVVSPDYPATLPVFAISLHWKTTRTNKDDQQIGDVEAEVNVHGEELVTSRSRAQLLSNQLQRLAMCLDVYLECETENVHTEGPVEFAKEKIFPRLARGPQRCRPYTYNPQLRFFSQR